MKQFKTKKEIDTPLYYVPVGTPLEPQRSGSYLIEVKNPSACMEFTEKEVIRGLGVWFEEVKEQRFEITNMEQHQDWNGRRKIIGLRIDSNIEIPTEKLPKIKAAIEGLLNKEKTLYEADDMIEFAKGIAVLCVAGSFTMNRIRSFDLTTNLKTFNKEKHSCG